MNSRFVGSYHVLHGGFLSNAALMLSGGLHDFYVIDLCRNVPPTSNRIGVDEKTKKAKKKKDRSTMSSESLSLIARYVGMRIVREYGTAPAWFRMVPNVDELFEILKYASHKAHIIGCSQLNVIPFLALFFRRRRKKATTTFSFLLFKLCFLFP